MFTAEQALEDLEAGEPIMVDIAFASKLCRDHDAHLYDYMAEEKRDTSKGFCAASILQWLGY